jgi:O-antigen ligase
MIAKIATLVYIIGILGLFYLERRQRQGKTSLALWIPIVWLLISGSRPVTVWLGMAPDRSPDQSLEGSALDRNFYMAVMAAGIAALWGRMATVQRILRANPMLVTFVLYCAVSTLWAEYPSVAIKRWVKCLGDIVMILVILTERDRLAAIKKVLASVGFVLLPLSVLMIKYYPDISRYYSRWEGRMLVAGVAMDKNMLGMTCLVFGLAAWWRVVTAWKEERGRALKLTLMTHGVVLGVTAWLFWMANSMTSLSCFAMAGGVITLATMRIGRRPAILHAAAGGAILVSVSTLFLNLGGGALESMGRNSTLTGRTEIWRGLLKIADAPLLGSGYQSFWTGDQLRKIWSMGGYLLGINESHNAYLEVFLNLGAVGVFLLTLLLIAGYRNVSLELRRDREIGKLKLAFFIVAVIYGCTEAAAFGMLNPVWSAFLLAITIVPKPPPLQRVTA